MYRGYIHLWRKFKEHEFWSDERKFSRAEAWIDMLFEAHWDKDKPKRMLIKNKLYLVEYGQLLWSIRFMAERWKWSKDSVLRFLALLKNRDMIETDTATALRPITIKNYSTYHTRIEHERDRVETDTATELRQSCDKKKKANKANKEKTNGCFEIPDWIDSEIWQAFREHRIKIKKPMTQYAEKLLVGDLVKLKEAGNEPNELLKYAIKKGWQSVYAIESESKVGSKDPYENYKRIKG